MLRLFFMMCNSKIISFALLIFSSFYTTKTMPNSFFPRDENTLYFLFAAQVRFFLTKISFCFANTIFPLKNLQMCIFFCNFVRFFGKREKYTQLT